MTGEHESSDSLSLREHLDLQERSSQRDIVAEWLYGWEWDGADWRGASRSQRDRFLAHADELLALLAEQPPPSPQEAYDAGIAAVEHAWTYGAGMTIDMSPNACFKLAVEQARRAGVPRPPQPEGKP